MAKQNKDKPDEAAAPAKEDTLAAAIEALRKVQQLSGQVPAATVVWEAVDRLTKPEK